MVPLAKLINNLINVSSRVQIEYIQYSALNAQLCLLLILNLDLIERRQLSVDLVETKIHGRRRTAVRSADFCPNLSLDLSKLKSAAC